jgi:hypothetical protein
MLIVNKNSVNDLVVTLIERQTLISPYYLVSVESHQSKVKTNCICASLSSNSRYDLIRLTESGSTSVDAVNGIVNLELGFNTYSIFEQSSSSNLDETLADNFLEKGIIYVSGSTDQIIYQAAQDVMAYITYNP